MSACPGGTTSNLFAHLARADVTLSISMTAASKVFGIVMMPLCLYVYARPFMGAEITIPYGEIVKALGLLLVPIGLAMALRRRFGERFAVVAEKVGSIAGLVVLVAVVLLMVVRNADVFFTVTPAMYLASILLSGLAMTLGYLAAWLGGLSLPQRRTVALETGIQNSALCFAVIGPRMPRS